MTRPAPSPPRLTLLHGWGLHGGIWSGMAEALGPSAEAPDLPGYGAEPLVAPYTAEALADALAARHPGPRVVCGWSLGGMAALAWAARHPAQVERLVLVATSPVFVQHPDWPHAMAPDTLDAFARELTRDWRATLLRFLSLQARGGDEARTVIARLRETVLARGEPAAATLADGLALLAAVDLRGLAARVRCPTLIVHGRHDTLCLPAAAQWLAETIPGARLVMHEYAAHAPFLSHPEWFRGQMMDFLDG